MRFDALRLEARDPAAVGEFYAERFGVPVAETGDGVAVSFGASEVAFAGATAGDPFYHFAVTVPANRFEDAAAWLGERTDLLADDDGETRFSFEWLDASACYFRDPAGNVGELIARHSLDNGVPEDESFGPRHLLAVSEIGVVVDDVPALADRLVAATGERDVGGGEDFRMVGDARGTFILVSPDRPWFPTGDAPGVYPTAVVAGVDEPFDVDVEGYPYRLRGA